MSIIDDLFRSSYPAVIIERWTGNSGWPCFKVFLIEDKTAKPAGDDTEYEQFTDAYKVAQAMAAQHGGCSIIDMSKGER
jgi:hypothetical protein